MANIKISELTPLTPPSAADELVIVDISATATRKTTAGEIVGIISGDVEVASDGTATISELPVSKLQDGAARQLLQTDAAGTGVEWASNIDIPGTLDVTGTATLDAALNVAGLASLDGGIDVDGAFTVANTSGNVATTGTLGVAGQSTLASAAVSDLTSGRVVLAGTSGELQDSAALTFNGTQLDVDGNVVITGDLTVEGASTILETETVKVEDKNIELGVLASPTDVTADGGGITLKGATDKTFNWLDATNAWTSSEHIDLASGKAYYIGGAETLSATALGSAVVSSSLTSVGTLGTGTWEADTIAAGYGGTGQTTYADGELLIGTTAGGLAKATITAGDAISVTNGDGSITIAVSGLTDSEVSASAAIAGTKISPDFGSQNIATTGDIDIDTGLFKVASGTNAIGFYGATPVVQASAIAGITSTATTGSLPSTDGSVTIADAAAPTVAELLEYCVELGSKLEAALTALRNLGLIAS